MRCARWCSPRSRRFRGECQVLIVANPRTTFLPAESAGIEAYLRGGGSLLAMFDLGFVLESRLADLVGQLGVSLPQEAIVDPLSHYASDSEMVAVTGYEAGPVTRNLSMTFFPGRPPSRAAAAGRRHQDHSAVRQQPRQLHPPGTWPRACATPTRRRSRPLRRPRGRGRVCSR